MVVARDKDVFHLGMKLHARDFGVMLQCALRPRERALSTHVMEHCAAVVAEMYFSHTHLYHCLRRVGLRIGYLPGAEEDLIVMRVARQTPYAILRYVGMYVRGLEKTYLVRPIYSISCV